MPCMFLFFYYPLALPENARVSQDACQKFFCNDENVIQAVIQWDLVNSTPYYFGFLVVKKRSEGDFYGGIKAHKVICPVYF